MYVLMCIQVHIRRYMYVLICIHIVICTFLYPDVRWVRLPGLGCMCETYMHGHTHKDIHTWANMMPTHYMCVFICVSLYVCPYMYAHLG